VKFASPVNGDKLFLTPEISMQIQTVLNSDIVMQFDECALRDQGQAHHRTRGPGLRGDESALGKRSLKTEFARLENPNALFGIVQGGMFACATPRWPAWWSRTSGLRHRRPVGGRAQGHAACWPHRPPAAREQAALPDGRGHAGGPGRGVAQGVDMFDCVMPTRNARNGHLFTRFGDLRPRNAYSDERPPTANLLLATAARASAAPTCTTWTAAAMLGPMLTTSTTCTTT
jgi:queuine tRNA-ribosyltransferase